jgi:hypothetical protein
MYRLMLPASVLFLCAVLSGGLGFGGLVEADDGGPGVAKVASADGATIPVYVDIMPQCCPNKFNIRIAGSELRVAVLGSAEFDVDLIDRGSAALTREGIAGEAWPPGWEPLADVATPFTGDLCGCHSAGPDGFDDLVFQFRTEQVVKRLQLDGLNGQQVMLTFRANLISNEVGLPTDTIVGSDCVLVHDWPSAHEVKLGE